MTPSTSLPTYSVTNWNRLFENNRSRTVRDLTWVPVPNKHDGEKYTLVMHEKKAAELFAAWVLILQVASRCHPRGSLVRADGTPYDPQGLALRTRAPVAWFVSALPYFVKNGWLTAKDADGSQLASACHPADSLPSAACTAGDEEGKGTNGRGGKRKEDIGSVAPTEQPDAIRERMLAINALFHRMDSTRWSAKEFAAFRDAGLDVINAADFGVQISPLATYYGATPEQLREHWRAKPGDDFRRRDLLTLLNNWPGEVDRARAAAHFLAKKTESEDRARN